MLKMTIKTFFIGLIILFNCQQLLASAVGNSNMLPATGKYYEKAISVMANSSNKEGNYAISPMAIAILDYVCYAAANEQARKEYENFYFYMENTEEIFESLQLSSFGIPTQLQDCRLSQPARQIVDVGINIILDEEFEENLGANYFLSFMEDNFPSVTSFVDLERNSEAAREKMNKWVEEFTQGKMINAVPSFTPGNKLAAVSVLYVRINWLHSFYSSRSPQAFYALKDGSIDKQAVSFITMSELAHDKYNAFELETNYGSVTAVSIPLQHRMAIIIYMPDSQAFSSFLEDWSQNNDLLDRILTQSLRKSENTVCRLRVAMPKFTLPSDFIDTNLVHQHFRLTSLFDVSVPFLSFSNESGINAFFHKAVITVDDAGIEDAGIEDAAVCGGDYSDGVFPAVDQYIDIVIKHPFLFQIVGYPFQGEGKMVYFTGQITDAKLAQQ